jgi:hypothetical protein
MTKGKMLFETPRQNPHNVIGIIAFTLLSIILCFVIPISYSIIENQNLGIKIFLVLFLMFGTMFFIGSEIFPMETHFRIYSNGITIEISSFSKLLQDEGKFIPFSHIDRFVVSKTKRVCTIFLKPKGSIFYIHRRNVITYLCDALHRQGIKGNKL